MLADIFGDGFAAHFFLTFKNDFDVDRQLAVVRVKERLEGFHFHPELAFIVDRAAGVDVVVALGRQRPTLHRSLCFVALYGVRIFINERRRFPLIQRVGRLDVIVRIHQDGGLAGGVEPIGIKKRMSLGGDHFDIVHADAPQFVGDKIGGLLHIRFVLVKRADAGNAEEVLQLIDKAGLIGTRKIYCR